MATHLKIEVEKAIIRLDRAYTTGNSLLRGIQQEYAELEKNNLWKDTPPDWAVGYVSWISETMETLQEVFLAGASKAATFENYNTCITRLGSANNKNFVTIGDKISDRLQCLSEMLTDVERHGVVSGTTVNVNASPGAIINTGSIIGGIHQDIGIIRTGGSEELAGLLDQLLKAATESGAIEVTELLVQQVHVLTKEAVKPAGSRNETICNAAWRYISNFASVATIGSFLVDHGDKLVALLHLSP